MSASSTGPTRLAAAFAAAAILIQWPIFDRWLSLLDEGYLLAIADGINHGHVLYRDINIDAPFPGAFYLLAWWFRVAGTSIWASRLLAIVVFTLLTFCVVRIVAQVTTRGWAIAVGGVLLSYRLWAFPHWHVLSYSSCAASVLSLAMVGALAHVRTGRLAPLAAAGVCAGAGVMSKQDYGLAITGATGLLLLLRPLVGLGTRRGWSGAIIPAAVFSLGVLAVVGPALGALALAGGLDELWQQAVVVPFSGAMRFSYVGLPPLRPLFHQDAVLREAIGHYFPAILLTLHWPEIAASQLYRETAWWDVTLKAIYYGPLTVWLGGLAAWGPATIARGRRGTATRDDEARWLLLAWAGGFLLAFNRPRDWVHLMMVYPPALTVGGVLLADGSRRLGPPLRRPLAAAGGTAILALGLVTIRLGLDLRARCEYALTTPRAGVTVDNQNGPIVADALRYVDAHVPADAPLPTFPTIPMLGFLADREPAAGFYVIWPVQVGDRDQRIIADLEHRHVPTILYTFSQYEHLGRFAQNAPALYAYLAAHYRIDAVFSREAWGPLVAALRRRDDLPSAWRDRLPADVALLRQTWPFAEVLATPVGPAAATVASRLPLGMLPATGTLRLRYAVHPDRWQDFTVGPITFEATIESEGIRIPFLEARRDPSHVLADRRWFDVTTDVGTLGGRDATLVLRATTTGAPTGADALAGWTDLEVR